jgi:hypothetical protein
MREAPRGRLPNRGWTADGRVSSKGAVGRWEAATRTRLPVALTMQHRTHLRSREGSIGSSSESVRPSGYRCISTSTVADACVCGRPLSHEAGSLRSTAGSVRCPLGAARLPGQSSRTSEVRVLHQAQLCSPTAQLEAAGPPLPRVQAPWAAHTRPHSACASGPPALALALAHSRLASLPFCGVRVDTTLFDQQGLCHTPGAPRLSSSDLSSSSSGECRNSPSFARPPCHTSCRTRRAPVAPCGRRCMSAARRRARARRCSRAPDRCLRAGADGLASVHTYMEQHRSKEHRPCAGHAAWEGGGLQPDSCMTLSTLPPPGTHQNSPALTITEARHRDHATAPTTKQTRLQARPAQPPHGRMRRRQHPAAAPASGLPGRARACRKS